MNTKNTWFEKTVEYNFVLDSKDTCGLDFLSPLDGSAERIGDLVAGSDAKHFIIEFKKELGGHESEIKKYIDDEIGYNAAKHALKDMKGYENHFVIGGSLTESNILQLHVKPYFSLGEENIKPRLISKVNNKPFPLGEGMSIEDLQAYTEILTQFRDSTEGVKEGSAGGVRNVSVIAVSNKGNAVSIPLHYYIKYVLDLTNAYVKVPKTRKAFKNSPGQ
ncbi:hypothetical protein [Pantoea vagans]|uniref:hypothetical protein n=1 Tax=Pantoea vagans TaxID=470934 RepID=UPI00241C0066|nr:hypothetical protein [Pantoea vagans]